MKSSMFWIPLMVVMAVLLTSSLFVAHAAEPAGGEQIAAAMAPSPEKGATLVCVYQPERATPGSAYYRGRAGQLEHRIVEPAPSSTGRLACKTVSGDAVKLFRECKL